MPAQMSNDHADLLARFWEGTTYLADKKRERKARWIAAVHTVSMAMTYKEVAA